VIGALCLSNLCMRHLMALENAGEQLDLVISQIRQLSVTLWQEALNSIGHQPLAATVVSGGAGDELSMLSSMIEKLDRTLDARSMFSVFAELLSNYMPFDMLAVIHDSMQERQCGVIHIQRPVHQAEVQSIFSTLAHQWQRRHRQAPVIGLEEATLVNGDLMQCEGACPEELRILQTETIPVFIDSDLFGLVCIAAEESLLSDRRHQRMLSILAHNLMLFVKKALLLVQNQEMQTVDALTGLYNERHFYQMMEREFDRAARYNVPLSLLFIDADHFKDVNETYGFETGDLLLQEISRIIMQNMRNTDFVSRYGGERFVVVLPETHYKNSEIMANRLRRFIENNSFYIPNTNVFVKVTVSIGVASYLEHKPASLAQFIEFADMALYFAKLNGRNQAVGYSYVINLMMGSGGHQS
jgi:diguanylate cyclase (GGDEF)-like protein